MTLPLLLLLLGWGLYFFLHSWLANLRVKAFLGDLLGRHRKSYRLLYNIFALTTLLPLVYAQILIGASTRIELNLWLRLPAVLLLAVGLLLLRKAARTYDMGRFSGLSQLQNKGDDADEPLTTRGINRRVRHPIYTANLAIFSGYTLFSPSLASIGLLILVVIYIRIGIWLEERKLLIYYGDSYAEYRRQVPMLIPRINRRPKQ